MASPRLDRAAHLRKNTDRLMRALDAPDTAFVPVWRSKSLVTAGSAPAAVVLRGPEASGLVDVADELVWLGLRDGADCFALDLSSRESPLGPAGARGEFSDLRRVGGLLAPEDVEVLAYARAILRWHRHHRYCGLCGSETKPRDGGHVRECPKDGERHFPRTDPAVMVMVEHEDACVLARQPGWPSGMHSVIAGFVEPGESIEEAAVRETKEELGLDIAELRYFRSQPWPFPCSLMLGFFARVTTRELVVDSEELESARWFSRAELENPAGFFYPPAFSLAHHLIRDFLERR